MFRRGIPLYARSEFAGKREYFQTFGSISLKRAMTLRAVHEALTDEKIERAKGKARAQDCLAGLLRIKSVPDRAEIERAVRAWLLQIQKNFSDLPPTSRDCADEQVRDLRLLDAEVVRVMRTRDGRAPLSTRWIAEALIQSHDWEMPSDGPLRGLLEDRVARGQRELAARQRAELSWEDEPQPTHSMFAAHEFASDKNVPAASPSRQPVPLMGVLEGYFAEQEPPAATVKKWTTALNSLIQHLGHDDAARVTSDDIVAWKNALLAADGEGDAPEVRQLSGMATSVL